VHTPARAKLVRVAFFLLVTLQALGSPAQDTFQRYSARTLVRDIAVDASNGVVFLAAYAREEIWKLSTTGEAIATAKTGSGPVALALSQDHRLVACVNKLSANVMIFDAASLTLQKTIACGEGAAAVAAAGDRVFAIANSLGDTVTVVDVQSGHAALLENVGRVPNAVAFSGSLLAVAARQPAALTLLDLSAGLEAGARRVVMLPAAALAVAPETGGRFVVATETELLRVDGHTGEILASSALAASDLAASGERIVALLGDELVALDPALNIVERIPVGARATRVDLSGGLVGLAAPADSAWLLRKAPEGWQKDLPVRQKLTPLEPVVSESIQLLPPEPAQSMPEAVTPEPMSPVPARPPEPRPEESSDTAFPEVVEAEPARESKAEDIHPAPRPTTSAVTAEQADLPATSGEASAQAEEIAASSKAPPEQKERPSESPEAQAAAEIDEDLRRPEVSPYAQRPRTIATFRTGAPEFTREAPEGAPLAGGWSGSLSEAFTRGWDFANFKGAFELQDWNQPLEFRGVKADRFRGTPGEDGKLQRMSFQGDVSWDWAESAFRAQLLEADQETREILVEGAHVERELSSIDADRLYYRYPSQYDEAITPLIESQSLSAQEQARRLYTLGYGEADNIELIEPFRELRAKHVQYDFAEQTGSATEVRGRLDVLHFGIDEVDLLGPGTIRARDAWITPCPGDPPIFRLRLKEMEIQEDNVVIGHKARLQIGRVMTPIYWPKWTFYPGRDKLIDIDFDSGRAAELGYYLNYGQRFALNRNADLGFRFIPTEKEGVGLGLEGQYDFMLKPSSPLFRGKGEFRSLATTEERGYFEAYHRHELTEDTVLLLQAEYWKDENIIKDFYYNEYRNRTEPRNFVNVTHTRPGYLATGTFRYNESEIFAETERLPEATYHLLDRQLAKRLYFSFDTIAGFNEREPSGTHAWRMANVARTSLDLDIADSLSIVPFHEADLSWYSRTVDEGDSDLRFANIAGVTAQSRFHRAYPGALGFSGFKHVIVPSLTYSYRPKPTMDVDATPRFDAYDNVYGRSRIEGKIENILFARDALTGAVWQAARLTMYHGDDFWNEFRGSTDYELELDLRPRPWWGILTATEHHSIANHFDLDEPFLFERLALQFWEDMMGKPYDPELAFQYNAVYGDYDRVLSYLYYDDLAQGGRFGARLGFAYTETQNKIFNREILYGGRYKLSDLWAFAFEHRYDLERGELYQQEYEVRKRFKCFDWSLKVRDRTQGWDFNVTISLSAFPGTKVKF
jgi:hypothetical protein